MGGGRHKRGVSRHKSTSKVQKRKRVKVSLKIKGTAPQVVAAAKQIVGADNGGENSDGRKEEKLDSGSH